MLLLREATVAHLFHVRADGCLDRLRQVRVLLDEARRVALVEAEQVVPDEHLSVAVHACADADRRHGQRLGDPRRNRGRHGLEHDREAAGSLERERVLVEPHRLLGRPALRLEAAEHRRRLGRQPEVTHHRDAGTDDRLDARERLPGSLELDRVGACLLDEADRVVQRLLVGDLERAERHVRDDERPARPAAGRTREHDHLVHRRGHGRVVAEHGHRGRVADEDHVGAGSVREPSGGGVVGRHHGDRLTARLQLGELGQSELPGRGRAGSGFARAGGHRSSSFRITLSISRVEPTRTAAASTGGSKSAIST